MGEIRKIERRADVVILTAIKLELDAVRAVEAGAEPGSTWVRDEQSPNGLWVEFRPFRAPGKHPLRVAVAQAVDMGPIRATQALGPLVTAYRPRCIAMCGVCAGRPGKTNLGDVIAADRLFFHDAGKQLPDGVEQDVTTYSLRDDWKTAIEHFDFVERLREQPWWQKRPVPYEWQENWLLAKLHQGVPAPRALPERDACCPQWTEVVDALWAAGHLKKGKLALTASGRRRIETVLVRYRDQLPAPALEGKLLPFRVHVGPIASGSKVVEDQHYWKHVAKYARKTLGLEMEAAAVAAFAHAQHTGSRLPLDTLVMKGVMDFANHGRDDHFKEFAARASAECLLAFLREHLEPQVIPGLDDLLVPGTEALPKDPPPSALLTARYEVVPFDEPGRADVLAELKRWTDEGPAVAVRLIHADGGVGKTRLAIEWTRRLREAGWAAGFLPAEAKESWFERLWSLGRPMAVVLDYAESRQGLKEMLLAVMRYGHQQTAGKLQRTRVLLLARNAGDW